MTDPQESLLLAYVAATFMHNFGAFDHILHRNNFFQMKASWHALLAQNHIYSRLQETQMSKERAVFDIMVIQISIEYDLAFMTDLVLEHTVITPSMLNVLLQEGQSKLLIRLVQLATKPKYSPPAPETAD